MQTGFPRPIKDRSSGGGGLPNLLDLSAYEVQYNWARDETSISAQTWETFIDEVGEGYLVFVHPIVTNNNHVPDYRIIADGKEIFFEWQSTSNTSDRGQYSFFPIYFEESIKVEVYNRDSSSTMKTVCYYTLFLKSDDPDPEKQEIFDFVEYETFFANNSSSGTWVTVYNITNQSGIIPYVTLEGGSVSTGVRLTVDGVNVTSAWPRSAGSETFVLIGPIPFNDSVLLELRKLSDFGGGSQCRSPIYFRE